MLGKLGELLNKDMGSLVKDAGKMLNTDVGALAKGAGKVLNTDLGTLLRDAEPALAPGSTEPVDGREDAAGKSSAPTPIAQPQPAARPQAAAPLRPAAPVHAEVPAPGPAFDPDATLKLGPGSESTMVLAPGGAESSPSALPEMGNDLVSRHQRKMPAGTSLLQLLPHSAGEFERPHATPTGELTSDPVSAMYSVSGHPVAVRLVQCWDEEEARDRLNEVKVQAGKNFRMGDDKSWILGETLQGLVFAWTRGNYSFTATAPKGAISMVRFLKAFPY
ncbi:MAG: hypothetical protein ABI790_09675 [Betaproteobacteria bacterium]